jgi:hypothetical protein
MVYPGTIGCLIAKIQAGCISNNHQDKCWSIDLEILQSWSDLFDTL